MGPPLARWGWIAAAACVAASWPLWSLALTTAFPALRPSSGLGAWYWFALVAMLGGPVLGLLLGGALFGFATRGNKPALGSILWIAGLDLVLASALQASLSVPWSQFGFSFAFFLAVTAGPSAIGIPAASWAARRRAKPQAPSGQQV